MTTDERTDDLHPSVVDDLVAIVPRLVERTRSQAEFARSILGVLPCVGRLVGRRHEEPGPGVPEHERVDVLSVLSEEGSEAPETEAPAAPAPPPGPSQAAPDEAAPDEAAPTEAELPIQDYDSLAASQVVPRLATLSAPELEAIRAYESATRHRQTILNRVAQLLSS